MKTGYQLRPDLPPIPARMRDLPVSPAGYPVPWFVAWVKGLPEFRCIHPERIELAARKNLCWCCGRKIDSLYAFVTGPMCTVNRVNAEPPNHLECARFAARACPFLRRPAMVRRETDMPAGCIDPAGLAIKRNPGYCAVYQTNSFRGFGVENGKLFRMGDPLAIEWYCEGRAATRAEVDESIRTGLPTLEDAAQHDGPDAVRQLKWMVADLQRWLPVEAK